MVETHCEWYHHKCVVCTHIAIALAVLRWRIPAGGGMVQWLMTSMIKIWLSDLYSSIGLY